MTNAPMKLLPCPFCGGVGNLHHDLSGDQIWCTDLRCAASGPQSVDGSDHAITGWNTRAAGTHRIAGPFSERQGWLAIESAPKDGKQFLAAINVYRGGKFSHWEYHIIWADYETGEIDADAEQGWELHQYRNWMPLPMPPIPQLGAPPQQPAEPAPDLVALKTQYRAMANALYNISGRFAGVDNDFSQRCREIAIESDAILSRTEKV